MTNADRLRESIAAKTRELLTQGRPEPPAPAHPSGDGGARIDGPPLASPDEGTALAREIANAERTGQHAEAARHKRELLRHHTDQMKGAR